MKRKKKDETDLGKNISRNLFEASASSSEDGTALEPKIETDSKPESKSKVKRRKMTTTKAKEELEIKAPDDNDRRSLYVKVAYSREYD